MKRISRRNFLKVAGVGAAALGLAAAASIFDPVQMYTGGTRMIIMRSHTGYKPKTWTVTIL